MWFIFIVAVLCGIILLYLPGALLLRSFRLSLLGSSLFAPPVTVALYGVLAIIYWVWGCALHGSHSFYFHL